MTNQAAYVQAKELVGEVERLLETLKERLDQLAPAAQTDYRPSSHAKSLQQRAESRTAHHPTLGSL
jgi:hypothetical protein